MKGSITTKYGVTINKGKPNWNKGIFEVLLTQMSNGLYCTGVVYFDTDSQDNLFFKLKQFPGKTAEEAWNNMDQWINQFTKSMGGYEYYER